MYMRTRYFIAGILLLALFAGCSSDSGEGDAPGGGSGDLYGYVRDASGSAIEGVVVSDGYTCTVTGADGRYAMQRHPNAYYVYYSTPADCKVEVDPSTGLPLFYQKIRKSQPQYDFTLTRQAEETKFRMLAIGDPQVTTTAQVYRFETETVADINSYVAAQTDGLPTYAITLGDIVGNKWELYPDMVKAMARSKTSVPVFQTIGNHDHEFPQVTDLSAQRRYEASFGPVNYSFTRGDVHFVSMDDIIHKATGSDAYTSGFLDWQFEWLKQDLSYVPRTCAVVLCVHIPFRGGFNGAGETYFDEVLELLAQFDRAWIFSAHTHNNKTNYTHTVGSKKIREYILGTSCGAWWHGTVCTDGAPNGYGVFEYDGTSLTNMIYKPTRYDETFQIRLYNGEDVFTGGTAKSWKFDLQQPKNRLMANVWNADDTWTIEVYENGVKTGDMAKKSMIDPWSSAYFCGFCGLKESYASKNDHIFIRSRVPVPRCASWRATVTATSSSRPRSRRRSKRTIPTPIDRSLRSVVFSSSEGGPAIRRASGVIGRDVALLPFPRRMGRYCSNATTFARIAVRVIPPASAVMRRAGAASWSSTWCVTVRLSGTSSVKVWPPSSMRALPSASSSR